MMDYLIILLKIKKNESILPAKTINQILKKLLFLSIIDYFIIKFSQTVPT